MAEFNQIKVVLVKKKRTGNQLFELLERQFCSNINFCKGNCSNGVTR